MDKIEKCRSVGIIEARMTSSRLPGKVMMKSCGKPMLYHMVERMRRSKLLDDIIIATTTNVEDDPIIELAERIKCRYFRGSENDVLDRVVNAAKTIEADIIVEVCGDCPFIDWRHIDHLLEIYQSGEYDFVSNNMEKSFPMGFDVRIFSTSLVDKLNNSSTNPLDHEHVSIHFPQHPEKYNCYNWIAPSEMNRPDIEVTLDERKDYEMINQIFEALYPIDEDFSCTDVIKYLDNNPMIKETINGISRTVIKYDG